MGQLRAGIVPVTLFQQNCTILFDDETKTGVVIDPGGEVDKIVAALEANKIRSKRSGLRMAILTMRAGRWS